MLAHEVNTNAIVLPNNTAARERQKAEGSECARDWCSQTPYMHNIPPKRAHFQPEIGCTCLFKYCSKKAHMRKHFILANFNFAVMWCSCFCHRIHGSTARTPCTSTYATVFYRFTLFMIMLLQTFHKQIAVDKHEASQIPFSIALCKSWLRTIALSRPITENNVKAINNFILI